MAEPKLKLINSPMTRDARKVLEDAIAEDFETVIIFGFKDGMVTTTASRRKNSLEILGALEAAKCSIWER